MAVTFQKFKLATEFFPSLAQLGCKAISFWLKMRSTGADVATTERTTFFRSGCSICVAVSDFSCDHGSLLATDDDICLSNSSKGTYYCNTDRLKMIQPQKCRDNCRL